MSDRFMRIMVFFDLPVVTNSEKRIYREFRSFLMKSGFAMMQNSVYSKILLNASTLNTMKDTIRRHTPKKGCVCIMCVTEKQFASIDYLIGQKKSDVIDSEDRVVEI